MEKEQSVAFEATGQGKITPLLVQDEQGELVRIDAHGVLFVEGERVAHTPRLFGYAIAAQSATRPQSHSNVLLDDVSNTFADCLATMTRKNRDYGGTNHDPYANFRNANVVGVSVEQGILVRLMDKMSRIATLLEKDPLVVSESVDDTIDDAINYFAILKSYRKNK